MVSKVEQITRLLKGSSYIACDGLSDYHAARLVRDANRCGATSARLSAMKRALARHRVTVTNDGLGVLRIRNNETGAEYHAHP